MGVSHVVLPEAVKLTLAEDEWILVRKKLTVGERHDSYEHMYLRNPDGSYVVNADGRLVVGPVNSRMALVLCYLVDWSLTGPDDLPLGIRGESVETVKSILRSLDEETFEAIAAAITTHERSIATARLAQKKTRNMKPVSAPTSPSPSGPAGPSERSAA